MLLNGVLDVRNGNGKRGRVGGPAGLSLDEPGNNAVELLLQNFEFGGVLGRKRLVGEFDQAINLPKVAFGFLASQAPNEESDRGAAQTQCHAAQVEILLEFIEKALLAAVEIIGDSWMHRQNRVLVIRVGRFDLIGERRLGHHLRFGLENGSRDRSSDGVKHRVWGCEAVGNGERRHRIVGDGRTSPEGTGRDIDGFEAGKPLVDRVCFVDGEKAWGALGCRLDGIDDVDDITRRHWSYGKNSRHSLFLDIADPISVSGKKTRFTDFAGIS